MGFANPSITPAYGDWPRVVACMERHGDAEGWVSRGDFLTYCYRLKASALVATLNEHQDELERRVVRQVGAGRPREEFRLKREA